MDKWDLVTGNKESKVQRADGLLLKIRICITNIDAKSTQRKWGWGQCSAVAADLTWFDLYLLLNICVILGKCLALRLFSKAVELR